MSTLEKKGGWKKFVGVGITLFSLAGCMQTPKPGYFLGAKSDTIEKKVVVLPPSIFLIPLFGGQYNVKKIIENGNQGIQISKYHWLLGKRNSQKIFLPKGAENMGVKNDPVFNDRFYVSYNLNGQKRLDQYHIGFAGDKCELKNQYIFNENKKTNTKNLENLADLSR